MCPTLQDEIDEKKGEITTDGYPMSIGELSSLYKEGELDIHPEFQRFFRWKPPQKSKLIESILLGIPIPSIFVAQRDDGVWDVVDGLQRLSTIFEFMGILKDENGNEVSASRLTATKYLPSLEGKFYEDENPDNSFTSTQRLTLKREKIDIKIVKRESHSSFKFELFQRLNTLGSKLSDQEVRNCLLVLINRSFYEWLRDLSNYPSYLNTLSLSERALEEQYDMELAVRFIVLNSLSDFNEIRSTSDLGEYLNEKIKAIAVDETFNREEMENKFKKTFDLLDASTGEDTFKKYNAVNNTFSGQFLISAYELVAIGLGHNILNYTREITDNVLISNTTNKIKQIWANQDFINNSGSGRNTAHRVPVNVPLGINLFANEN